MRSEAEFFRWNAEETVRIHGSIGTSPSGDKKIMTFHPPVGVVVIVTPWNYPAAMITRKLAPALGAGNGVVIKPAREAPLTGLRIGELLEEAGVPPGLVNLVPSASSGAQSVVLDVMRTVQLAAHHDQVKRVTVTVADDVAFQILNTKRGVLHEIEEETGKTIRIHGDAAFVGDQIECACEDDRGRPVPIGSPYSTPTES